MMRTRAPLGALVLMWAECGVEERGSCREPREELLEELTLLLGVLESVMGVAAGSRELEGLDNIPFPHIGEKGTSPAGLQGR